ncbi:MAG: hypothetical protein IJM87_00970 [Ruminococcus sp.]|nr:hypothetical protein [Ruminococcus sp.]
MNTPAITGEGIVLENPGDSITTEGTGEELRFDSDFKFRWEDGYNAGDYDEDEYSTMMEGNHWGGVTGFFIDDNGIYRISEFGDSDYFYPDEGCIYVVTYEPASSDDDSSSSGSDSYDYWHIEQVEDDRVDLSTADVQVNTTDKTITVVDADGNPVDSGCYTVEFVKGDSSSTEFPTEGGEYTVVVTAAPGARHAKGVNDNAIFTIAAPEESESESTSESTADSSEVTSEAESTSESEAESQADESSEAESTADTSSKADSSSKADASSKAASTASTTNPGTGAAAAMGILAVTTAGVVVTKKKSR